MLLPSLPEKKKNLTGHHVLLDDDVKTKVKMQFSQ
jgi:hypothetical protein